MANRTVKVVDAITYQAGAGQYIVIGASHGFNKARGIYIKKNSGSGTLDLHGVEYSVDGVNYFSTYSLNNVAAVAAQAELTSQSAYAWMIDAPFPYLRLKIDVNTDTVNLSVSVSSM